MKMPEFLWARLGPPPSLQPNDERTKRPATTRTAAARSSPPSSTCRSVRPSHFNQPYRVNHPRRPGYLPIPPNPTSIPTGPTGPCQYGRTYVRATDQRPNELSVRPEALAPSSIRAAQASPVSGFCIQEGTPRNRPTAAAVQQQQPQASSSSSQSSRSCPSPHIYRTG